MASLQQVALVVGASRGIGRQIAIDLAKNNYKVVVAAKTTSDASTCTPFPPDPNSPKSTINTVVREIHCFGGIATAIPVDVRDHSSIQHLVSQTIQIYGRLDVLIYNSGAIYWSPVSHTSTRRFLLMQQVNPEGLYATIHCCLPHFADNGHQGRIIVISPPIYSRFFRGKTAYAMGKVGMSVLTKGLAMDFEREGKSGMAITSLWPATAVESAATNSTLSLTDEEKEEKRKDLRKATVFADAVMAVLRAPANVVNGLLDTDEDFLQRVGKVTDFDRYAVVEGATPRRMMPKFFPDLTVEEQADEGTRVDSREIEKKKASGRLKL